MLTVAEAHAAVGRHARALAPCRWRLSDVLGLRLAADVTSAVDSPPFDKSLVDGFAIATTDAAATLRIAELVTAGAVPTRRVEPGTTIRVMTGAPVPAGADAVVKWEDCRQKDETAIDNPTAYAKPGACILRRGASFHAGQVVLAAGKRVTPLDVALLAEIGHAEVAAYPRPTVGVLATGDELVAADQPLGPGQIRNSNGPMLLAAIAAAGATAVDLGVARDDPADLRAKLERGLAHDVLLVSGGVSAGVKDLVPGALAELGVEEVFHQVKVKPGKPLLFGVRVTGASATGVPPVSSGVDAPSRFSTGGTPVAHGREKRQTLVFGLPGNPVSTFVSFKLFVEPALTALAGGAFAPPRTERAKLAAPFKHRGGRPTYQPCRVRSEEASDGQAVVEPLDWKGSADIATLTRADCLAALPAGDYELAAGDAVDVIWL